MRTCSQQYLSYAVDVEQESKYLGLLRDRCQHCVDKKQERCGTLGLSASEQGALYSTATLIQHSSAQKSALTFA